MTAVAERPLRAWLHRETPLGVPALTPVRVQPLSENCYFQLDGIIVRMVFLGGLSGTDEPSASAWTLRATPQAELSGIDFRTGWQTQIAKARSVQEALDAPSETDFESHRDALAAIGRIAGFSRRELTAWLKTSHTTLNGIANSQRNPRSLLARRITNFYRLVNRLETLHGDDQAKIRQALETAPEDGKSALHFVLEDDYQQAATAAQRALRPKQKIKPIRGEKFYDVRMVAVEDL